MMTSSSETFSALLALCAGNSPVTNEFPSQRPVTQSFDVFFDLRLNKQQSWCWLFETPSRSLWCHHNDRRSYFSPVKEHVPSHLPKLIMMLRIEVIISGLSERKFHSCGTLAMTWSDNEVIRVKWCREPRRPRGLIPGDKKTGGCMDTEGTWLVIDDDLFHRSIKFVVDLLVWRSL